MKLYAESSAVLAWLLGEQGGAAVRSALIDADTVITSELTLIECDRVLIRAVALGEMPEATATAVHGMLNAAAARWHVIHLGSDVVDRARRRFPVEPVRTLDALHLAAALVGRTALADLAMLSLDRRVRAAADALGLPVQPTAAKVSG